MQKSNPLKKTADGQTVKKRVLVMPSYWPTSNAPVVGSQVQEQTRLMSQDFDVEVICCVPGMGVARFFLYTIVRWLTGKQLFKSCDHLFINDGLSVHGVYFCDAAILSRKASRKNEADAAEFLLRRLMKKGWQPDLVHTRTAEYAGYIAARLAKKYDLPLMLTENCIFILGDLPYAEKLNEYKFALESADTVAVVSTWLKTQLMINNFKCDPVVVGNWINEQQFSVVPNAATRFSILTIGHTGFTKDWPTFFKAIHYLVNDLSVNNISITIAVTHVYDENSRNYIPNLVAEYHLQDFCKVVYQVPRAEVAELYHHAHVMVSTSINETFGIATAESLFCGVPVIATANGAIDDFLTTANGVKVAIGDYVHIATALKEMYDGSLRFNPQEIRQSVIEKFGTASFRKRIASLYESTIAKYNN